MEEAAAQPPPDADTGELVRLSLEKLGEIERLLTRRRAEQQDIAWAILAETIAEATAVLRGRAVLRAGGMLPAPVLAAVPDPPRKPARHRAPAGGRWLRAVPGDGTAIRATRR